ncbi:hypothetical protein COCON_G00111550 [Conger conger]|uniref:Uncharacterized protein n=1 Tax=Conger conger TaxID=82655 RepID=A0A9Q1DJP9_CONCO|nr:uncharacterized protein LOC133131648 [Conger conger]XP_061103023.1 uncharacterized protein LOC133131648 [Conger conger]KAJ8272296.1 hypothetical protein COCON_G00111550 [Conger conger]
MMEDTDCRTADRCHVDSLLNISEESFAKISQCGMPVQSAWEQVVKGWNECPPLACLFQLQNKCRPDKSGEHEFHCLLCIDANLVQKLEVDQCANSESSETKCSLAEDTEHLEAPQISPSENFCPDAEQDSFKYEKTTTIQDESCKVTGRAKLKRLPDTSTMLTYMKFAMQCPIIKEKGIINKFSILPPVKGSGYPRAARLRSAAACALSSPDSLTAVGRSYSLSLTGEGHVERECVSAGVEILEYSHRSLTAKCYQSPPSRRLMSAVSTSLPKRCSSLNSFEGTLSRAADFVGRRIKNESPIRAAVNNQGYNQRRTENELPILLGTRVPIQAMSHRIVSISNA